MKLVKLMSLLRLMAIVVALAGAGAATRAAAEDKIPMRPLSKPNLRKKTVTSTEKASVRVVCFLHNDNSIRTEVFA